MTDVMLTATHMYIFSHKRYHIELSEILRKLIILLCLSQVQNLQRHDLSTYHFLRPKCFSTVRLTVQTLCKSNISRNSIWFTCCHESHAFLIGHFFFFFGTDDETVVNIVKCVREDRWHPGAWTRRRGSCSGHAETKQVGQ